MRQLHRWFGLITGIIMAVVAATGVSIQVMDLMDGRPAGGPQFMNGNHSFAPPPSGANPQNGFGGPGGFSGPGNGRPPLQGGGGQWRSTLDHIHDGEYFGTTGRVVSIVMGIALFFFCVSGIWIYWQMLQSRFALGKRQIFW